MIKGYVVGGRETVAKIRGLSSEVRKELVKSVWRIVLRLQRHVKENKLSGQVLHVRTGTLRRSINAKVTDTAWAVHGVVGTNVIYGRIHELGYTGPEQIKAHVRTIKEAWGRPLKSPKEVWVKAHVRQVKFPERSFLRSSLMDMGPEIRTEFESAVGKAARLYW